MNVIPHRAPAREPYPHCIYCKGNVRVFVCHNSNRMNNEYYVGCDHLGCYARGPIAKTRKGAVGKYNKLVKRVFWSKRKAKESWPW